MAHQIEPEQHERPRCGSDLANCTETTTQKRRPMIDVRMSPSVALLRPTPIPTLIPCFESTGAPTPDMEGTTAVVQGESVGAYCLGPRRLVIGSARRLVACSLPTSESARRSPLAFTVTTATGATRRKSRLGSRSPHTT